jgi:hypothetical protein
MTAEISKEYRPASHKARENKVKKRQQGEMEQKAESNRDNSNTTVLVTGATGMCCILLLFAPFL